MVQISFSSRYLKSLKVGEIQAKWSANGERVLRYYMDIKHTELGLHKQVSAPQVYLLEQKVAELIARWDRLTDEHRQKTKLAASKEACEVMTEEAAKKLKAINEILNDTLNRNDRVNWEALKDKSKYEGPLYYTIPKPTRKPLLEPNFYEPRFSLGDILLFRRQKKMNYARQAHEAAMERWQKQNDEEINIHNSSVEEWQQAKEAFEEDCQKKKEIFLQNQKDHNARIDTWAKDVKRGEPLAVIEHASLVLEASDYNGLFEKSYELDYQPTSKTLEIEYELPSPSSMPTLKMVRFTAASGEIKETHLSEREQKQNFDSACYQICLRTLHEIFEADEHDNIHVISFNGFTTSIDRATGKDTRSCIMSILVKKADFEQIELSRIDPKTCFKTLKGVSASSLAALAPIAPILNMNKQDKRFIDAKDIASSLDAAANIAAMDWSDFEHLIRELFEKEFASRGGEVRITQASSDGGVDAVAFDPDPITGGKIVIQAKRYTRTVGVSAVRDLFGTMQHEGASRGILISTADYGPDAYKFANGKPISLFGGSNLLHLLQKHGYNAKIDLKAARGI